MDTIAKATALLVEYAPFALAALAGLVVALAAIAPLTKSKADDKALELLRKLQVALAWVVVKLTPSGARQALASEVSRQAAAKVAKK